NSDTSHLHHPPTRRSSHLAVDQCLADNPELLLVYGGDGTVARIVDALLNRTSRVPLGILAGGTANALAEQLGCDGPLHDQLQRRSEEHTSELQSREKLVCR